MEWIDPRYEEVVAAIRARQEAEVESGLPERPLRGFIIPVEED
ncbi:hypothetical protein [Streptomyces gobiensis]|nr:hypothetical protein [Streptomyces gobiensis]